jgi:hypothetical protein
MGFLLSFIAWGMLLAAIPCCCIGWVTWRLTKQLRIWLRLQITIVITTLLAALISTPVVAIGHGVAISPLGLILFYAFPDLIFGTANLSDLFLDWHCAVPFSCVWGVMYFTSMVVVSICHFVRQRNAKLGNPPSKGSPLPSDLNITESPKLAIGATADERLAPLVKKNELPPDN